MIYNNMCDYYEQNKPLQWKTFGTVARLYDNGQHVASIIYNEEYDPFPGLWRGTFQTSDNHALSVNPVGSSIEHAKDVIERKYSLKKDVGWWNR